jgi:hypothetical protein
VIDPVDVKILYAASYQRRRTSWGFNGGGPGSAIWKTADAGKTWTKLEGNGLPEGLLGRIGLDISRSSPNVVYAQIEVGAGGGAGGGEEQRAAVVLEEGAAAAASRRSPTNRPTRSGTAFGVRMTRVRPGAS